MEQRVSFAEEDSEKCEKMKGGKEKCRKQA